MQPEIIYSNRLEELGAALAEGLFLDGDPFAKRWVVVPTQAIKGWIQRFLAEHPQIGVALGVRFLFLEEALRELASGGKYLPSEVELTLRLESLLPECEEVRDYLGESQGRLHALAAALASHFRHYGIYGQRMLDAWSGWQRELWEKCHGESWTWAAEQLREIDCKASRIHLFGFSYLPPLYQRALRQSKRAIFYVLSPCAMYWEDTRSDREQRRLQRFFREQGVDERQLVELDALLREGNPLIGNWGRVGRQFIGALEAGNPVTTEHYVEPEGESQLEGLQRALLLLERCGISADGSVEVHSAPNRWREVEVLHNRLLRLMEGSEGTPGDVVVMAPNIEDYSPFLRAVFGREGKLPLQIQDLVRPERGSVAEGFLGLLELVESRWEVSRVMGVLEHPCVREQLGLSEEELECVRAWIERVGIRWGLSPEHQRKQLKNLYGEGASSGGHSWEEGLDRLARGLVVGEDLALELSDSDLLGRLVTWIEALGSACEELSSRLTVGEWVERLEQLGIAFLGADPGELPLAALRGAASQFPKESYGFLSIRSLIEGQVGQRGHTHNPHHLDAVRCCSLLPMRAIPAKVVCVLGMDEGAYPRHTPRQPFDLLASSAVADYRPATGDLDRYLFLEAVLSARESLLLFFSRVDGEDGKAVGPSLLVEELMEECGLAVQEHPYLPFHHGQFPEINLSPIDFARAQALYGEKKGTCRWELREGVAEEDLFDLRDLALSASDPVRLHLSRALGVELGREVDQTALDEEPFALSALELHRLAFSALEEPLPEVIAQAERLGQMPAGPMGELARERLEERVSELKGRLSHYGVASDQLQRVRLDRGCVKPTQLGEQLLELPPLELNFEGRRVEIVGELPLVTPAGLFANARNDLGSVARAWPAFLVYAAAGLPGELLLARSERAIALDREEARAALESYLAYYFRCLREPAPLRPDWMAPLLAGDAPGLAGRMERDLKGEAFVSPYLRWLLERERFDARGVIAAWSEPVKSAFGPLAKAFGGKR